MSDYPMLISNKLHSFRNFLKQRYKKMQSPFRALHRKMPIADIFSFTSHFLIALPRFSVRFRQVVYHTSGKYSKFLYEVLKKRRVVFHTLS